MIEKLTAGEFWGGTTDRKPADCEQCGNSQEVTAAAQEEASGGSEAYLRSYGNHSTRADICYDLLIHYQYT